MSEWGISEWGFLITGLGTVATSATWLYERHEKRKLERELKDIQRRGRAPFLRAMHLNVPPQGTAGNQIFHLGQEVIPAFTGEGVVLVLDLANDGEPVRDINDDWAPPNGFTSRGIPHDRFTAARINYRYDPKKHGQPMRIRLNFETMDGLKLHHVYEMRHGFCEFRRVDPA